MTDVIASNSIDMLAYFERRMPHDAADLVAEAMMTAWRRSADVPGDPTQARMWLFGVARNVLANALRAEHRRWQLANRLRLMLRPADGSASDEGAEVRDAVDRLDPELAELIRLVHWDGFSIAEAAQISGVPASTARTRYQRAKSELRRALSNSLDSALTTTGGEGA